jgi:hypothetical protein
MLHKIYSLDNNFVMERMNFCQISENCICEAKRKMGPICGNVKFSVWAVLSIEMKNIGFQLFAF